MVVVVLVALGACSSGIARPEVPTWEPVDAPFDISPDLRFVLYLHRASRDAPQGVYMLDRQSDGPPRLLWEFETGFDTPYDPRFSPDATRLVMTRDFIRDIYLYDIETGEDRQLTFTNGNAKSPVWDPIGKRIAYVRWYCGSIEEADTTCGLFILDVATAEETRVLHNGRVVDGANPRWSPDGSLLAVARGITVDYGATWTHIFTVTPDGSSLTDCTPREDRRNSSPVWLSDVEVLYRSEGTQDGDDFDWRVVNTRTGVVRRWDVDLPRYFSRREFSRDGRYVVYTDADPSGLYGVLYLQRTNDLLGRKREQLTTFLPIEEGR